MAGQHVEPPASRRDDVTELLHGRQITDPYRWLEDGDSLETAHWVAAQNHFTHSALEAVAGRSRLAERLEELLAIGMVSAPVARMNRYFHERRSGRQNQPVLYVRDGREGKDRELLDPNAINPDGTTSLDWWYPSPDGRLVAYGLSQAGDERSTLYLRDVERAEDREESIPNTRAASVAWLADSSGFYYTRYPREGEAPPGEEVYHRHVYRHGLGSSWDSDASVFGDGRDATDWPSVHLSIDGRYLLVTVSRGWDRTDCYLRVELPEPGPFMPLIEQDKVLSSGEIVGDTLYLVTNLDAPRFRLLSINLSKPEREHWRELVAEHPEAVLQEAHVGRGKLLLSYLHWASSRLELRDLEGHSPEDLALPTIGSVGELSGEPESPEVFFSFSSFANPPTIYCYDFQRAARLEWATVEAGAELPSHRVEQVSYHSRDGTDITMFVIRGIAMPLDGNRPTVLTGYGGFNISLTPTFSRSLLFWLEQGGVYAVPNLRGGGEYGEGWHQAGMRANKQNVFDDLVAAAEYLCQAGYTNPGRLAVSGGSNGGLLVGAVITQRPDLFRAAVCAVPLLDMLRYDRFEIARLWTAEYGSPASPEEFEWLLSYSPYHHVRDGTEYPAVLLLTAESDTRVDPLHARKMAARLQSATASNRPILLRVETSAGHGAGKPLVKTLAEQTDLWSFLCWQLGVAVQ